jgi:hypothetical protein
MQKRCEFTRSFDILPADFEGGVGGDTAVFAVGVPLFSLLEAELHLPLPQKIRGERQGWQRTRKNGAFNKRQRIKFWNQLCGHINRTWKNKYGVGYPWQGIDRAILAQTARKYSAWDVMALWDIYLAADLKWKRLVGFLHSLNRWVDDPSYKSRSQVYHTQLFGPINDALRDFLSSAKRI